MKVSTYLRPTHLCTTPVNLFFPDVRQCLIYDAPAPNARLIGVEYMISGALYKTLSSSERKLWHSHVFEVKSGMLIMPGPDGLPTGIWDAAETKEMEEIVGLYGKTYHFWQVDRGDKLPLGEPQLMMSLTKEDQCPGFTELLGERDSRYGVLSAQKKEKRAYIEEPEIHEDADSMWKEAAAKGEQPDGTTKDQEPLIKGTSHRPWPSPPPKNPTTQLTNPRHPLLHLAPSPATLLPTQLPSLPPKNCIPHLPLSSRSKTQPDVTPT